MSKITKITQQRNKARVNLFVDGSFFCSLMAETAIANGLKENKEVDEEYLKEIILESEQRRAMDYCLFILAKKPYTRFELKTKLITKGYEDDVVYYVLNKLSEYNYVNDSEYAQFYANNCGLKSARQIEQKLMQKGVSSENIKNAVNGVKIKGESDKIAIISAKYLKNKPKNDENLNKLFRYLVSKGFSYEDVKSQIRRYKDDESWD
ncbi:MAG: RecX family transcriptional regulator [Clostridia bacterium]|nr:RecX family transcriptional regulator [Clostridia bacterium]